MKQKILVVLLFTVWFSVISRAATKPQQLDELFHYLAKHKLFNGAVLVVDGGKTLFERAVGFANMEWRIPNTTDTRFDIGSVTKQFTAVLILQLAAEKKVVLHEVIGKYLPQIPEPFASRITLHQLLTHTSGLPSHPSNQSDYMKVGMRIPYTFDERLEQLRDVPLDFEPGTSWAYNGFGYTILGHIAARVTQKSLEANFRERIFSPLGMNQSGVLLDSRLVKRKAYRYQKVCNDAYIPAVYFSQSEAKLGGGGLYSTLGDLRKWHRALQGDDLLPPQQKMMFYKSYYRFPDGDGYCYGYYSTTYRVNDTRGVEVFFHGGSLPGASALLMRVPENDQCIVLFHNAGMGHEVFLQSLAGEILNILYTGKFHFPRMGIVFEVVYTAMFNDMQAVKNHYFHLKQNHSDAYAFAPEQLNMLAGFLLQFGAKKNVPGVFKLNITEYPDDPAAYYGLGGYYWDMEKDAARARTYLKMALTRSRGDLKAEIAKKLAQVEAAQ